MISVLSVESTFGDSSQVSEETRNLLHEVTIHTARLYHTGFQVLTDNYGGDYLSGLSVFDHFVDGKTVFGKVECHGHKGYCSSQDTEMDVENAEFRVTVTIYKVTDEVLKIFKMLDTACASGPKRSLNPFVLVRKYIDREGSLHPCVLEKLTSKVVFKLNTEDITQYYEIESFVENV